MAKPKAETTDVAVVAQPGELSAPAQSQAQAIAFAQTPENIELLKQSLADAKTYLTDGELGIFLYQAQKTGLDPLARQIYVMKREGGGVSFMTSIDGQRLIAQRTGEYEGQTSPQWCGTDGKWKEVWLEDGNPSGARIGVYRKGMREPVYGVATWKSYNQGRGTWNKMGDVMLSKCAEALALRKAFPQELSGLYTTEEMNNNDEAVEPPRTLTTKDALAEAGKTLVEKGFTREEALDIMMAIADVDDASKMTGSRLGPILEIVHRESKEQLAEYLATDETKEEPAEAEIVEPAPEKPADTEEPAEEASPAEQEDEPLDAAAKSMLFGYAKSSPGFSDGMPVIDYIEGVAGKSLDKIGKSELPALRKLLKETA